MRFGDNSSENGLDIGKNRKMFETGTFVLPERTRGRWKKGLSADESKLNEDCFNLYMKGGDEWMKEYQDKNNQKILIIFLC